MPFFGRNIGIMTENTATAFTEIEKWRQDQLQEGRELDPLFVQHLENNLSLKAKGWVPDSIQNTYLKDFEVPQIVLFDILTNRFPLLQKAQWIAEKAYCDAAASAEHVAIIDIGIGRGFQVFRLLEKLSLNASIKKITLIGIEISAPALDFTRQQLQDKQPAYPFALEYHLLNMEVENLSISQLVSLLPEKRDCTLVNASLTLHHIQKNEKRIALFDIIRQVQPELMVLIEPHADTASENYAERLINAAEHFSALYEYVNSLSFTQEEERSLKTFFANDFFDPVVLPDAFRFERLQMASQWMDHAAKGGLKALSLHRYAAEFPIAHIQTEQREEGHLVFSFQDTPLLSVIGMH